ncbi:Calcineurin-like phosphoesterase [Gemmata sp. SH-PL17]|uniref:metallophosphoesterase family protein n=1 Tax=Gemmata sp. SH-PL17 TaxID=1630693 RepID=UPI00078E6BE1|nr:metallophosphoesterase [Gemmata sp. SH-PL17]AMV28606.1 Calcineurin-like phosphoesterase [Gemmata sp. SH-PL17]
MAIRLAHFSDIHLTARPLGWRVRDTFNKRTTGLVNVRLLGRGARFFHANDVTVALRTEFASRGFDHLVFSGDATALGFPSEMTEAATRLGVGCTALPPGIAVPGNHDLYIRRSVRDRFFETPFAPWQQGQRVTTDPYPFAQKVGHVWLIALNSAKPNVLFWDATGRVGVPQLERFRALCAMLDAGPRIVVSHYPLLKEGHQIEPRWHRLHDWRAARDAAAECGVSLWLHGHRHHWYALPIAPNLPFPTICTGSSTQTRRWGYHDYTIDGWHLKGQRRVYDLATKAFVDTDTFEFELPKTYPPGPLPKGKGEEQRQPLPNPSPKRRGA